LGGRKTLKRMTEIAGPSLGVRAKTCKASVRDLKPSQDRKREREKERDSSMGKGRRYGGDVGGGDWAVEAAGASGGHRQRLARASCWWAISQSLTTGQVSVSRDP